MALQGYSVYVAGLTNLCGSCQYTKVLEHCDDSITVLLEHPTNPKLCCRYSLIIAADHEGVVVCQEGGDVRSVPGSAEEVLKSLVVEWCAVHQLIVPENFQSNVATLNTQVSVASSEYTDCSETDFDEEDYDSYEGYETDDTIHPLIEREIARVQQLYGRNSIETRIHAGIDEMDIFFNIDLNNFMDEDTALAWGVRVSEPLVILLHIRTVSKYLNGVEPMVEVFQSPTQSKVERKKVAIGNQLKKIIGNFVTAQWKKLSNADVESQMVDLGSDVNLSSACAQLEESMTSPAFLRQDSLGAQMRPPEEGEGTDPLESKTLPGLENGFLVQCLQYGINRFHTLNEFCVICDEKHVIESGLIKPCVCTRELCVFAFQTLGVMADAAETIATDGDVVDLLIAMAHAAVNSPRAKIIFNPFPSIVHPEKRDLLALDPKKPDYVLVRKVLEAVVSSRERMVAGHATSVKEELDDHHRLAFPLMQWVMATCRAHIVLLPEHRRIPSITTKYQFLLISSPPAKEAAFHTAKAKWGSTFAFHGSNIENWHSIMRSGLVNASGTKLQLHGAAYGNGIYLSPMSSVSFGYMGHHSVSGQSSKPKPPSVIDCLAGKVNLRCMALCEVVTSKDLKKSNNIWVCPNPEHVCTRFFFVFDNSSKMSEIDTRNSKYKHQINHAVAHIKKFRKSKK